ncbi:hypothetical protein F4778DRAFT_791703 [Xylariomycetidae sp. FL2044]|nr:hypothetical protein F4778DRAFT_791703 [Xylariomycetidae sp. FL2044]
MGLDFSKKLAPGPRSPEKRLDKYSFFDEITTDQLCTYSPDQIATILRQRENLQEVLKEETLLRDPDYDYPSPRDAALIPPPPGFGFLHKKMPWVPYDEEECQVKFCHTCRPSCGPRTYLSLNGILAGDIPPTVATGYGFHRMGFRPTCRAEEMRYIGLRAPRVVKKNPYDTPSIRSLSSVWSFSDDDEETITFEAAFARAEQEAKKGSGSAAPLSEASSSQQSEANNGVRASSSPPPTPESWIGGQYLGLDGKPVFIHQPTLFEGRSATSLKANQELRERLISSMPGLVATTEEEGPNDDDEAIKTEEENALPLTTKDLILIRASLTSLPPPTPAEEAVTPMISEEMEEGRFHQEPLDVDHGVAILEESVGLRVADLVTQM